MTARTGSGILHRHGPSSLRPELNTVAQSSSSRMSLHDYAQHCDILRPLQETLKKCQSGIQQIYAHEKALVESRFVSSKNPALVVLEKNLLDLASYPDVTSGVFYCLIVEHIGNVFARFLGSGCFRGLMETKIVELLSEEFSASEDGFLHYRVYSHNDIQVRGQYLQKRAENISRLKRKAENQG